MMTPSSRSPGDVTQLLLKWRNGDKAALDQLMRLVNYELRRLARACLRREHAERTMQTADLVNEAFLRLIKADQVDWRDRAHFFAVAAEVMRRVLVEEARKRKRLKRGGSRTRVDKERSVIGYHDARVKSVAFSPDCTTGNCRVASAGEDQVIAFWDVKQRNTARRIGSHASPV